MDYEGVNSIVCDAEESDWLDVTYSERKYVAEEQQPAKKKRFPNFKFNFKLSKPMQIVAVVVLSVALLAALLFIDGNFASDVFQTAKEAFSASVFDAAQVEDVVATIAIPSNVNLVDIVDGVATFDGGRTALSFTNGTVTQVTETSVTVAMDDTTCIVYDGLTDIFVSVGDQVAVNTLLAKYDGTFTATVTMGGDAVTDVIGSETQLTWNV